MSDTEADRVDDDNRQTAGEEADAAANEEQARRVQELADARAAEEAASLAERAAAQQAADAAAEEERASRLAAEAKAAADAEAARKAAQAEALRASEAERAAQIEAEKKAGAKKPNAAAAAVKSEVTSGGDALQAALGRLTDGKVNYVMLEVSGKRGAVLSVADEGTGGFSEMLSKLQETKVYFIGIKVLGVDERNVSSTRTKYAVATYIGTKAPMMVKAGAATTKAKLTQAWSGITLYYAPPDLASFTTEDLKNRLLACGGAHKPSYYDFGDGTRINLGFYSEQKNQGN